MCRQPNSTSSEPFLNTQAKCLSQKTWIEYTGSRCYANNLPIPNHVTGATLRGLAALTSEERCNNGFNWTPGTPASCSDDRFNNEQDCIATYTWTERNDTCNDGITLNQNMCERIIDPVRYSNQCLAPTGDDFNKFKKYILDDSPNYLEQYQTQYNIFLNNELLSENNCMCNIHQKYDGTNCVDCLANEVNYEPVIITDDPSVQIGICSPLSCPINTHLSGDNPHSCTASVSYTHLTLPTSVTV